MQMIGICKKGRYSTHESGLERIFAKISAALQNSTALRSHLEHVKTNKFYTRYLTVAGDERNEKNSSGYFYHCATTW